MKKMDYQNVRGTNDYLPEKEMLKRKIERTLEDVFEQYGYQPLETPILNYTDLMASKYAGGSEILEEMYTLTDRGERELALRYDLTIPFTKVMAMNPSLNMPFKRYEIGKVFRDGPIKKGRFREFTQCDVDIAGVEKQIAEAELMMLALDSFEKLELEVQIQFNNRKLLVGLLELFGIDEDEVNRAVLTIDKLEKIGVDGVVRELREQGLLDKTIENIQRFLKDENNTNLTYYEEYFEESDLIKEGIQELTELISYLDFLSVREQCIFTPTLARGLEIYTGTIYEVFLTDDSITSSVGSGGRYNNAIGGLRGTEEKVATVGLSIGLDVVYTAMQTMTEQNKQVTTIDYYVIPLQADKEALLIARVLRRKGYKVMIEMGNRRLRNALDKANKEGVENVIIIGENEVNNNMYKVKNMKTGKEEIVNFKY